MNEESTDQPSSRASEYIAGTWPRAKDVEINGMAKGHIRREHANGLTD